MSPIPYVAWAWTEDGQWLRLCDGPDHEACVIKAMTITQERRFVRLVFRPEGVRPEHEPTLAEIAAEMGLELELPT